MGVRDCDHGEWSKHAAFTHGRWAWANDRAHDNIDAYNNDHDHSEAFVFDSVGVRSSWLAKYWLFSLEFGVSSAKDAKFPAGTFNFQMPNPL